MCRTDTDKSKRNYKVIATKVSPEAAEMLDAIARRQGTTVYTMLQLMCKVFVKLMADDVPLTADLAKIIRMFDAWNNWDRSFNIVNPSNKPTVTCSIYFLSDNKKDGEDAVLIDNNRQTYNVQNIVDKFLSKACPNIYRRLMLLSSDLNCMGAYDALDKIIDLYKIDPVEEQVRKMFTDNCRSEFGRSAVCAPYVRHQHKDINTL